MTAAHVVAVESPGGRRAVSRCPRTPPVRRWARWRWRKARRVARLVLVALAALAIAGWIAA